MALHLMPRLEAVVKHSVMEIPAQRPQCLVIPTFILSYRMDGHQTALLNYCSLSSSVFRHLFSISIVPSMRYAAAKIPPLPRQFLLKQTGKLNKKQQSYLYGPLHCHGQASSVHSLAFGRRSSNARTITKAIKQNTNTTSSSQARL